MPSFEEILIKIGVDFIFSDEIFLVKNDDKGYAMCTIIHPQQVDKRFLHQFY